jgi:hypothetical protein
LSEVPCLNRMQCATETTMCNMNSAFTIAGIFVSILYHETGILYNSVKHVSGWTVIALNRTER